MVAAGGRCFRRRDEPTGEVHRVERHALLFSVDARPDRRRTMSPRK